jgi:hydrogenase maturation factor
MITCTAVLAKVPKDGMIRPSGMREGDDIVMTKWAGLEGTAVIASDFSRHTGLDEEELRSAGSFMDMISVVKEGVLAAKNGAHAMHDVTEGGIYGAVWEMAFASGIGVELDAGSIPIHPVTGKICGRLGLDPYRLLSSGCMIIACENGKDMAELLCDNGIKAEVIGKARGKGVRLKDGTEIEPPEADEIYKLFRGND